MEKFIKMKVADAVHQVLVPHKPIKSWDSDAMAFFIGQLTGLEAQVYEAKYPEIFYNQLVPINTSFNRGVENVAYRSFDGVTMAKFIGAQASDLPKIAMSANLTTVPVGYGGIEAGWNLNELYASQMYGQPISDMQMRLAFRGYQEHAQRVAFFGDKERGMGGLLNNENVTVQTSTLDWDTVTDNQQIIDELNKPLETVWNVTKGAFLPNVLLIPAEKYGKLTSTRMMPGTDTSILNWFKENNFVATMGQELEIRPVFQVNGDEMVKNGITGSKGRIVAYRRDRDCLEAYHPLPFETLPPQYRGLEVAVPSHYKISGTDFKQPLSACYVDLA